MNKSGADKIIVMPPPWVFESYDIEELLSIHKKHSSRMAIVGGGGTLNPLLQKSGHFGDVSPELRKTFEGRAEKIINSGVKGFGEIAAHHVSLNRNSSVRHERGANLERRRYPGVLFQSLFRRLAHRLITVKKFAQQRD